MVASQVNAANAGLRQEESRVKSHQASSLCAYMSRLPSQTLNGAWASLLEDQKVKIVAKIAKYSWTLGKRTATEARTVNGYGINDKAVFVRSTRLVYLAVLEPSRPACERLGGDDRLPTGTRWRRAPTEWSRLLFYLPRHGSHKWFLCPFRKQRKRTCMALLSSMGKLLHSSSNGGHLSSPGFLLDLYWDLGRKRRIGSEIEDCLTQ